MRTIEYGATTHVPAFLTKLWKLVTDESCDELICWSYNGNSFIIYDEIRFSKELLPMYFKHNNMASFVRQLNMYGFRKLSCVDQGGMHCYKNEIEFYHQYFLKGQESLLELIKRKIPNNKSEDPKVKQEYIDELLSNIKSLRNKQENSDQCMRSLRRENRILWRQVNVLTDNYSKQQAVLQQLVPFFMNMVRSNREVTMKRKPALMMDESDIRAKLARMSPPYYLDKSDTEQSNSMPSPPSSVSNRGPVIHDVTEMESHKMFPANILCSPNASTSKECEAIVDSPLSCNLESSEQTIDCSYNEPGGSMETINILNQNFERSRSNSTNSRIELKTSPVSSPASSQRLHLSPPCTSPSERSPVPSFSPVQNGISPVAIVDETTSDVPLTNLMSSSFAPKIENVCTENGMFTISSILRENASSVMNEKQSLVDEHSSMMPCSSRMNEDPPPMSSLINNSQMINEGSSTRMSVEGPSSIPQMLSKMKQPSMEPSQIITEQISLGHQQTRNDQPPRLSERLQMLNERSASGMEEATLMEAPSSSLIMNKSPLMNEETVSMMESPSLVNEKTMMNRSSLIHDAPAVDRPPMMNEKPSLIMNQSPLITEASSSMINRPSITSTRPSSVVHNRAAMMSGGTSIRSNGGCLSRDGKLASTYFPNGKNAVTDMNWAYNPEPYTNEANIENWLGQIFKTDNLVAGCSLPQD